MSNDSIIKGYKLGAVMQFERATFIGKTTETLNDKTRFIVRAKSNEVYTVTAKHVMGVIEDYRKYYESKEEPHTDKQRKIKSLEVLKVYLMALQCFPTYFSTKLLREVTSPEIFTGQAFKEAHAKENVKILKEVHYTIGVLSTVMMQYCTPTLTIQNLYQQGYRDVINPVNFTSSGENYVFLFPQFAEKGHIRYLDEDIAVTNVTVIEAIVMRVMARYGLKYGVEAPSIDVKANPKLEDVVTVKDEDTNQYNTEIQVDMPEVVKMDDLGVISVTIGAAQKFPTTLTIYTLDSNNYIVFLKSQDSVLSVQVGKAVEDNYYSSTTLDLVTAMTDCLQFPTPRQQMTVRARSPLNPNSRGEENQSSYTKREAMKEEQKKSFEEQARLNEIERKLKQDAEEHRKAKRSIFSKVLTRQR